MPCYFDAPIDQLPPLCTQTRCTYRAATDIKVLEAILESMPQLFVQMYILLQFDAREDDTLIYVSIALSVCPWIDLPVCPYLCHSVACHSLVGAADGSCDIYVTHVLNVWWLNRRPPSRMHLHRK